MKFWSLCSGSSGNCTYIGDRDCGVLVDAGISAKRISQLLDMNGISGKSIAAIFVTHEHSDHICGLYTLAAKLGVPVVASQQTLSALENLRPITKFKTEIIDNKPFNIGDIEVIRFQTSHDCAGSSGYRFNFSSGKSAAVCTDLGIVTDEVRHGVLGSDIVLFESNHDLKMLKNGPYPPYLKLRIMGDNGHLSNNMCAAELSKMLESGTTRFVLGHLSQHNNLPLLAKNAATGALADINAVEDEDYILNIAAPTGNKVIYL